MIPHTRKAADPEIEITPEMIEAWLNWQFNFNQTHFRRIVEEVMETHPTFEANSD